MHNTDRLFQACTTCLPGFKSWHRTGSKQVKRSFKPGTTRGMRNASRCEVVARLAVLPLDAGVPVCWFTMVLGRVSGTCQVVDTRAAESALRETASARRDRLRAEDQAAANAAAA